MEKPAVKKPKRHVSGRVVTPLVTTEKQVDVGSTLPPNQPAPPNRARSRLTGLIPG